MFTNVGEVLGNVVTPAWNIEVCPYCQKWHAEFCPRIEAIEYYENGNIKKIIFKQEKQENKNA